MLDLIISTCEIFYFLAHSSRFNRVRGPNVQDYVKLESKTVLCPIIFVSSYKWVYRQKRGLLSCLWCLIQISKRNNGIVAIQGRKRGL